MTLSRQMLLTLAISAELGLARAQLNERLSLVQLYNALGGGWQQ
jgi:multidrug efflux system outer membrane protein